MSPETFSEIKVELSQLHALLDAYRALLDQVKVREPNNVELLACAGILHSFYSGLENIFKRIAKDIDGEFAKTGSWHSDLLETLVVPTPKRPAILSEPLKERLQLYLSFRHVFRSAYSYDLNWSKMQDLVFGAKEVLLLVENELNGFMKNNVQ
jgi:hypothetical protein